MAGGTQVPVWMGRAGAALVVRPEGACTVAICETVHAGLQQCAVGDTRDLYFDLARAEWIDSTFAGFLVSLVTREKRGQLRVHLVHPMPTVQRCLEEMHVLALFDLDDAPPVATAWQQLTPVTTDGSCVANRVVDCHEKLIEADPRNAPAFEPVVKLFRAQQTRDTGTPDP